ncbi:hypothetical protein A6P54_02650 [Bacillus sp. MKU004]|nr:hypothetical protein A6P54_02650 [Bacillus sp. MKU004]
MSLNGVINFPQKSQFDIFIASIPSVSSKEIASLLDYYLLPNELKRYYNYKLSKKRLEFLFGRILIKVILSEILNIEVKEIVLDETKYGKPYLVNSENINFNLSHSNNVLALVVSKLKVGIDIETLDQKVRFHEYKIALTKLEFEYLEDLKNEEAKSKFLTLWTKKEAFLKAIGKGLSVSPKSFQVPILETSQKNNWYFYSIINSNFVISTVIKNKRNENIMPKTHFINILEFINN